MPLRRAVSLSMFLMLAIVAASPCKSQNAPLILVDGTDAFVGEVVSTNASLEFADVLLVFDGGSGLLRFQPSQVAFGAPALFTTADCSGTPYLGVESPFGQPRLGEILFVVGGNLWHVDPSWSSSVITVASSQEQLQGDCTGPLGGIASIPAQLVGPWSFQPPYRVVRNPAIFGDDFSTGDPARWSNF